MDKKQSICATCKHLHAIYSYDEKGLCFGCICTANDNCWVNINRLCINDKFIECKDYEHCKKEDMKIKVTADIKDLQKIAIQYDMLINGGKEDGE